MSELFPGVVPVNFRKTGMFLIVLGFASIGLGVYGYVNGFLALASRSFIFGLVALVFGIYLRKSGAKKDETEKPNE